MASALIACDDSSSGGFSANNPYYGSYDPMSYDACYNQPYQVGIINNPHCPYQGQQVNGRYEWFAKIEWSGAVYLDFGFRYNDACPAGQVPVYEHQYGQLRLKRCEFVGNDFVDTIFYNHHNTSSCNGGWAGDRNCIPSYP